MKRVIAIVLCLVMVIGCFSACADGNFRFSDDTSLSRGQWIQELSNTFGLNEYVGEKQYFSDVDKDDPIFAAVQSCYEWDVLRDVAKKIKKDKFATLEFAVTTAVYAAVDDFNLSDGDSDAEKAINFAYENGIIEPNWKLKKRITQEQSAQILSKLQFIYLNQEVEPIDIVDIKDSIIDERDNKNIRKIDENKFLISDFAPQEGEIIIAPGDEENPNGIAIKVESVTLNEDGSYTVETITPEVHEVFEELEFSGVVVPEFEDIVPAEGVIISGYTGTTQVSSDINKKPKVEMLGNIKNTGPDVKQLGIADSKDSALSFSANLNLTKGTVSLNPSWGNFSTSIEQLASGPIAGDDAGKWFEKKSVFPDKTLFGPDAYSNDEAIEAYEKGVISADELRTALNGMTDADGKEKIPNITNKFSGGYEVIGSLSITDLYIVPEYKLKTAKVLGVDTGVPTGIESFSIVTNYGVSGSLSVKGKIENELTICSIPVTFGGVATLTIEVIIYTELNGEISVKFEISNNTKTEYNSGKTKKTSQQTASASVEAELEFETGPKLKAKISVCAIPFIDVNVSAAVNVKANVGLKLSTEWTETDEAFIIDRKTTFSYGVIGNIPIVKIGIGLDGSTLANKLNIKFSWTIVGSEGSNAPWTAYKFDILPEETKVLWEDHKEIPKENLEETTTELESQTQSSESLGGNLMIGSYYIHLEKGEKVNITIDYPEDYSANDFLWSCADEKIAVVKDGQIKAKKSGVTTVTVTSADGKYYANCAVYVGE